MPDIGNSVICLVSFDGDGQLDKYEYEFDLSVAGQDINFHYDLTVKNIDSGVIISDQNFPGLATSEADIAQNLNAVKTALSAYRSLANSGYNYDVKTNVDFANGRFGIGSRTQGRTMRKIDSGTVYFWNRIEFDSDYKNADLYKTKGIVDYERYRAKIANGDVYDREDGYFSNPTTKVADSIAGIDEFYFLPDNSFFTTANVSILQYAAGGTDKVYSIGLNNAGVKKFLEYIDDCVRVDVDLVNDIQMFAMEDGSLAVTGVTFDVTLRNGALYSITASVKGSANGKYDGTKFEGSYMFTLGYSLTVNNKGDNYTIPEKDKDITLPNS